MLKSVVCELRLPQVFRDHHGSGFCSYVMLELTPYYKLHRFLMLGEGVAIVIGDAAKSAQRHRPGSISKTKCRWDPLHCQYPTKRLLISATTIPQALETCESQDSQQRTARQQHSQRPWYMAPPFPHFSNIILLR